MKRLTIKRRLPPKGVYKKFSEEDLEILHLTDAEDVYFRLQEYEDTGLTPEEVEDLKADNNRLHRLIDELESGLRKENGNA